LAAQSNEILTAVVSGVRKEELRPEAHLAAVRLLKSLQFVRDSFECEVSWSALAFKTCLDLAWPDSLLSLRVREITT
jgi:hypothetical protein